MSKIKLMKVSNERKSKNNSYVIGTIWLKYRGEEYGALQVYLSSKVVKSCVAKTKREAFKEAVSWLSTF